MNKHSHDPAYFDSHHIRTDGPGNWFKSINSGLDEVLYTMNRMHSIYNSFQKMAPMFRQAMDALSQWEDVQNSSLQRASVQRNLNRKSKRRKLTRHKRHRKSY